VAPPEAAAAAAAAGPPGLAPRLGATPPPVTPPPAASAPMGTGADGQTDTATTRQASRHAAMLMSAINGGGALGGPLREPWLTR